MFHHTSIFNIERRFLNRKCETFPIVSALFFTVTEVPLFSLPAADVRIPDAICDQNLDIGGQSFRGTELISHRAQHPLDPPISQSSRAESLPNQTTSFSEENKTYCEHCISPPLPPSNTCEEPKLFAGPNQPRTTALKSARPPNKSIFFPRKAPHSAQV